MSRIRLNQELRNKGGLRFRGHLEQENTQEKENYFKCRESFKALQDKTWELAKVCVERAYPKEDVLICRSLKKKYGAPLDVVAKDK